MGNAFKDTDLGNVVVHAPFANTLQNLIIAEPSPGSIRAADKHLHTPVRACTFGLLYLTGQVRSAKTL